MIKFGFGLPDADHSRQTLVPQLHGTRHGARRVSEQRGWVAANNPKRLQRCFDRHQLR